VFSVVLVVLVEVEETFQHPVYTSTNIVDSMYVSPAGAMTISRLVICWEAPGSKFCPCCITVHRDFAQDYKETPSMERFIMNCELLV
jgi:hypothetical protein